MSKDIAVVAPDYSQFQVTIKLQTMRGLNSGQFTGN